MILANFSFLVIWATVIMYRSLSSCFEPKCPNQALCYGNVGQVTFGRVSSIYRPFKIQYKIKPIFKIKFYLFPIFFRPNVFQYTSSHVLWCFQSPSSCILSLGHIVIPLPIDQCGFELALLLWIVGSIHWSRLLLLQIVTSGVAAVKDWKRKRLKKLKRLKTIELWLSELPLLCS